MSFFDDVKTESAGSFEMGGGDLAPIPKDTQVLAVCEEAKVGEYEGNRYISIKWRVHKPEAYQNRVIFQKLKVFEKDADKARKAKQMLFAIGTNAGGKLFDAMKAANESEPSDTSLTRVTNVPMVLKLGVWELDDKSKNGNWVQAVSPYSKGSKTPEAAPKPAAKPKPAPDPVADSFDDDIPF